MSDTPDLYTPTDEEREPVTIDRVRDMYSWATAWRADDLTDRPDLERLRERNRAEFDAAMSAHDARIRAEAQAEQREADAAIAEKCDPVEVALSGAAYVAAAIRGGKS